MRTLLLLLSLCVSVRAEVALTVDAAWYEPDAKGGVLHYQVRTNLPDRALLEVSLESRFDSVAGPLVRVAARGRAEVKGGACTAKIDEFPIAVPAGRYALVVAVSAKQRDDVEEALGNQAKPVVEKQVYVGGPNEMVEALGHEMEGLSAALKQVQTLTTSLDGWIDLSNQKKLGEKGAEYAAWRQAARKAIDDLVEQSAIFHDKYPTHFPSCYAGLSDVALNLGDHESSLWRSAQGKTQGNDPEAQKVKSAAYVEKKLGELRFKFVWEASFALADVPATLAGMAAPDSGLAKRDEWGPWKRELEAAVGALEKLATQVAPASHERTVHALDVDASLPKESADDAKRQAGERRGKAVAAVGGSSEAASKGLKGLIATVDAAVGADAQALPAGLKRQRDELVATQEALRVDLRTFALK